MMEWLWYTLLALVLGLTWVVLKSLYAGLKPIWNAINPLRRPILVNTRLFEPQEPCPNLESRRIMLEDEFSMDKVPSDLDVIVIGSGISGLTTAVLLARAGKKVLVLEQYRTAGGLLGSCLEFDNMSCNLGFHVAMDKLPIKGMKMTGLEIFDQLTMGAIKAIPMRRDFLVEASKSTKQKMPQGRPLYMLGPEEMKKAEEELTSSKPHRIGDPFIFDSGDMDTVEEHMLRKFPNDKHALKKFFSTCKRVFPVFILIPLVKVLPYRLTQFLIKSGFLNWLTGYDKWINLPFNKYLDELGITNLDLRKALYMPMDYFVGDIDARISNTAFIFLSYPVLVQGFSYLQGGPRELVYHVIKQIKHHGGRVLVKADVTSILLDDQQKKAIGVVVKHGNQTYKIKAPIVVSGAGVLNTCTRLLPEAVVQRTPRLKTIVETLLPLQDVTAYATHLSVTGSTEELGIDDRDYIFKPDNEDDLVAHLDMTLEQVLEAEKPDDPIFGFPYVICSFASPRDPYYPKRYPGKTAVTLFTMSRISWFKKWEGKHYTEIEQDQELKAIEEKIAKKFIRFLEAKFPHIKGKVSDGICLSFHRQGAMTKAFQGQLLGPVLDSRRLSLTNMAATRPYTGLPGLYMIGADMILPSTQAAALTGYLAASEILERNLLLELELMARSAQR